MGSFLSRSKSQSSEARPGESSKTLPAEAPQELKRLVFEDSSFMLARLAMQFSLDAAWMMRDEAKISIH